MKNFTENMDLTAEGIWLPIIVGLGLSLFVLFMRKRLSWGEIYLTFGTIGYVTWFIDVPFMARYLDLFDVGNPKIPGIGDVITYGVIPSCLAVIYLNYFVRESRWTYVAGFTVLSFLFEWLLVQSGYMKLKGWQTWWSIPVYIAVYGYWLPWHLRLMQNLHEREGDQWGQGSMQKAFRIREKAK